MNKYKAEANDCVAAHVCMQCKCKPASPRSSHTIKAILFAKRVRQKILQIGRLVIKSHPSSENGGCLGLDNYKYATASFFWGEGKYKVKFCGTEYVHSIGKLLLVK